MARKLRRYKIDVRFSSNNSFFRSYCAPSKLESATLIRLHIVTRMVQLTKSVSDKKMLLSSINLIKKKKEFQTYCAFSASDFVFLELIFVRKPKVFLRQMKSPYESASSLGGSLGRRVIETTSNTVQNQARLPHHQRLL